MIIDTDKLNPEHEGFCYDPKQGQLFRVKEIAITSIDSLNSNQGTFKGQAKRLTHIIFFLMSGRWPEKEKVVDHKNGNIHDSRWENLREASRAQNQQNRPPPGRWKDNELGLETGVRVAPSGNFRVVVSGSYLGTFLTAAEANNQARLARRVLHGEFDYNNREVPDADLHE